MKSCRTYSLILISVLVNLAFGTIPACAQSSEATFVGSFVSNVQTSNGSWPTRIATDAEGNLYLTDVGANALRMVPADGGPMVAIPVSGLNGPEGVAVDGSGNIYVGDDKNGRVVKLAASGGQSTVASGLSSRLNLAVDATGNLFISDGGNNQILEIPVGGKQTTVPTTGLNTPFGIGLDAADNLYIADKGNNQVVKVEWTGSAYGTQSTVLTGLNYPADVKVDKQGNIFIADFNNHRVVTVLASGNTVAFPFPYWWYGGCTWRPDVHDERPNALAIGNGGNVYVAEWVSTACNDGYQTNGWMGVINLGAASYPAIGIGNATTGYLEFSFPTSITLSSVKATAQGASGQGYSVSGGSCSGGSSFSPGAACTLNVNFQPGVPGESQGEAALIDSNNVLAARVFLNGFGTGPQIAFNPGTSSVLGISGLSDPEGGAIDAAGNVYVADFGNNRVVELPAGGGAQTTLGNHLSGPSAVAVDGAGNVYIANATGNNVKKISAVGAVQTSVGSGFSSPQAVATDGAGNLYVADTGNDRVVEIPASGAAPTTIGSGLSAPAGLAIDIVGNIYIADTGNNRVVEVPVDGGAQTLVGSGLSDPHGLAVDAALNVYIADTGNDRLVMVPSGGNQATLLNGLNQPYGLSLDGAGNLYVVDSGTNRVLKVDRTDAPTLTFANTPVGSQSSDSPLTANILDIGTQPLALNGLVGVVLSDQNNFYLNTNSDDCVSGTVLTPGANCLVETYFTPTAAGAISGTVTLTDNTLSAAKATQIINLSGTGTLPAPVASSLSPSSAAMNSGAFTLTVNGANFVNGSIVYWNGGSMAAATTFVSASKLTVAIPAADVATCGSFPVTVLNPQPLVGPSQGVNFTVNCPLPVLSSISPASATVGSAPVPLTVNGSNFVQSSSLQWNGSTLPSNYVSSSQLTATIPATDLTAAGSVPVTVVNPAPGGGTSGSQTFTINPATPTITWPTPAAITYGTALSATQLDATANVPGTFTYSPAAGAVLLAGSVTLSVSFVPTDTADYTNASATVTIQVNQATPAITWPTPAAIAYGTPLSTTQLDANANVPGGFTYSPAAGAVLKAGAQTLKVTFTPTDAADYTNATGSVTLQVNKAAPSISWPTPAPITYGTALSTIQLNATSPVGGSFTYTPAAGKVLGAGSQTLSVSLAPTDAADYTVATATVQLQVNQAVPAILWQTPAPITYGTALSATQLNATSTVAGSFAYTPAAGKVLSAGVQTLSTTFSPSDAVDYTSSTVTVSLTVNKAVPAITWPTPAAITYGTALSTTQLDATSAVRGTFTYSPAAGVVLAAGRQTLSASFAPNDTGDYTAPTVTVTLQVNQAVPAITWPTPAPIAYGTALSTTQLDATTNVAGTFTYTPSAGAVLKAGTQTLKAVFAPTDTADYTSPTTTVQLQVNQAVPTITWATPAAIPYGTPLSATQLNATANVSGNMSYKPGLGTVLKVGSNPLSVTFTPTDAVDYTSSTVTVTLQVIPAKPVITWPTPAPITYGTALSGTQLNATSPVQGSFTYTPAAGTVLKAGQQTLTASFAPTDSTDYTTATATVQLRVNPAIPAIRWSAPAAITYGTALSSTQLNAIANIQGTFTYTPPAGTLLHAGTHSLMATFAPTDSTDYTSANATVAIQVNQAKPAITWASPAAITYGTPLSTRQLNASASVPGSFVYTPAAGTVLKAGVHTLSATFTPTDSIDYASQTVTVSLTVNKAAPVIAWAAPASIPYGTPLSGIQLNASSPVPGTYAYTPPAGTVLKVGAYTLKVVLSPADSADYLNASAQVTLTVTRATPPITWAAPSPIPYGTALSITQLDAKARVPGTMTYNPKAGTVLPAGKQTLNVTFTPTDNTDYSTATDSVSLTVLPITASPAFQPPAGTYASATSVTISDSTPGAVVYYTTNGTAPTTASTHYKGPITISATTTIKAIAIASGYAQSPVATAVYTIGQAKVSLSATTLAFGNQPVNTPSMVKTVTLTNTGNVTLNISSIELTGEDATSFLLTHSCGSSLNSGAACSIKVLFYPTSKGADAALVAITDNAAGSPQTIKLTGTGQ